MIAFRQGGDLMGVDDGRLPPDPIGARGAQVSLQYRSHLVLQWHLKNCPASTNLDSFP
jgi:hypothetical protein